MDTDRPILSGFSLSKANFCERKAQEQILPEAVELRARILDWRSLQFGFQRQMALWQKIQVTLV